MYVQVQQYKYVLYKYLISINCNFVNAARCGYTRSQYNVYICLAGMAGLGWAGWDGIKSAQPWLGLAGMGSSLPSHGWDGLGWGTISPISALYSTCIGTNALTFHSTEYHLMLN